MSQGFRIRPLDDPTYSGTTHHGAIPRNAPGERPTDPRALYAINRVRLANGKPLVEEVSVFDPAFSDATDGVARVRRQCQRCRTYLVAGHRARKWCYACAAEVEQERKDRRDKARDRERKKEAA